MKEFQPRITIAALLFSTSAFAFFGAPALAQTTPDSPQSAGVGDILVTATRRSENLQSVPIAVTALSSEALASSGIRNTEEIGQVTPGLTITNQTGGITPFIRGIGSSDVTAGAEAAVATYIDNVYISTAYGTKIPLINVERIEVLKGPQGTLFGRNAAGGLINIITKDPSQTREFEGRASYGNYDTVDASVYANMPISEDVAVNFAGTFFNRMDGFGTNLDTGNDTYRAKDYSYRAKVKWEPTDATSLVIAGDFAHFRTQEGESRQFFPGVTGLDTVTGYTGDYYDSRGTIDTVLFGENWGVSGTLTQDFDLFDVKAITAYRKVEANQLIDVDITPAVIGVVDYNGRFDTFSQELQFTSKPNSPIKWIGGLFYLDDNAGFDSEKGISLFGPAFGTNVALRNTIGTKSYAAFGEVTVPVTSRTNLTVGGRYTIDKRKLTGDTLIFGATTYDNPGPPLLDLETPAQKKKYEKFTYRAILDHHFTDDVMGYASYSRGYKAGNFNAIAPGDAPFEPEQVDSYEAGFKSTWFDRMLRLNGSVYFNDYKDLQVAFFGLLPDTSNANAEIYGAELEAELALTENFSVRAGAAYTHAEFTDYQDSQCFAPNPPALGGGDTVTPCDATGNRLPKSPRFTLTVAPTYTLPTQVGDFTLTASWFHSSSYWAEAGNFYGQDAYDIVNARLGWMNKDGNVGFAVFGKNLLDEKYISFVSPAGFGTSFSSSPPLTYGAELTFKY